MVEVKRQFDWQWVLLWCIIVLALLYARPPMPIDETRYLSVAWEMWHSHNFLVPHINGEPYSQKPPLLFWFIHLLWSVFGVSEWAGRLVGPLFALGSMALTIKLARLLWPGQVQIKQAAAYILLGFWLWTVLASLTMFDTLLTFFFLFCLISLLQAAKGVSIWPWIGLGLSMGLGILAKGPVIFLFVVPSIILAPWWHRQHRISWRRWFTSAMLSLAGGLILASCWALPAALAGGNDYSQAILFSQTAGRMVSSFAHKRPFYWYLLWTPLLFFPWFFYPPSWRGWQKATADQSIRFCLCALIPPLLLLSFVSGKQIHYILPILPISALLLARIIVISAYTTKYEKIPIVAVFFALSVFLLIISYLPLHGGDKEILRHIPKWLALIPLGCGAGLLVFKQPRSALTSIKVLSLSLIILTVVLHLVVTSPLHSLFDQSAVGKALNNLQAKGETVAVFPPQLSDQFQFAGRLSEPLVALDSMYEISLWSQQHPRAFCLIFTKDRLVVLTLGKGFIRPYRCGWLVLRPASGFPLGWAKPMQRAKKSP